jgi:hypothetical protein
MTGLQSAVAMGSLELKPLGIVDHPYEELWARNRSEATRFVASLGQSLLQRIEVNGLSRLFNCAIVIDSDEKDSRISNRA